MKQYAVKDYAINNTAAREITSQLQKAIDQCAAQGDTLVLEAGIYLSGTLLLRDHTSIELAQGAMILGSEKLESYPENTAVFVDAVGHKRGRCLLLAKDVRQVHIFGQGTVCGRGALFGENHPQHLERPFLVRVVSCKEVCIEGVRLTDAAAWCLHLLDSEEITVQNIEIRSRCNGNNDGIDIDACQNVKIEHCTVDTGDDALCLKTTIDKTCKNISIRDCVVSSDCSAFKIGTESVGDFENVLIENCFFYDVNCCAIKIVPADGATVKNVVMRNLQMRHCTGPIFVTVGERFRKYFDVGRTVPGVIDGLYFENIAADCIDAAGRLLDGNPWGNAKSCVVISGLQNTPIKNVFFHGCSFQMAGGSSTKASGKIPVMGARYPEFHLLGDLPAWGLYARWVNGLHLDAATSFTSKEVDARDKVFMDDVIREKG